MAKMTGGCQCGAVRYEAEGDVAFSAHCQCVDCKKSSGAGHVTAAAFPEAAVTFSGKTKSYASKADSGVDVSRDFCPECGGRLALRSPNFAGMVLLMAGSLDDPSGVSPGAALYEKHHVAWDYFDPALPRPPGMPPA